MLDRLPLAFEANRGQTSSEVLFLSRQRGFTTFVARGELVMKAERAMCTSTDNVQDQPERSKRLRQDQPDVFRLKFLGSNSDAKAEGLERLPGTTNYIRGNNSNRWVQDVPSYGRVRIRDLYPGIDLVFYGQEGKLEYDLVLQPGANPNLIRLGVDPGKKLNIDSSGNLRISAPWGYIEQAKPTIFQEIDGRKVEVSGRYARRGRRSVAFQIAAHDSTRPLTIDPSLIYSTYLGGTGSDNGDCSAMGNTVATDSFGDVFVAGSTLSTDFPTGSVIPIYSSTSAGDSDIFVTALDSIGNLIYSTYIGGSGTDIPSGIGLDPLYNVYLAGYTNSSDFPVTDGAFLPHLPVTDPQHPSYAGFMLRLDITSNYLVYSTYVGGAKNNFITGIAIDELGAAYVTGYTESTDFPIKSPFQSGSKSGGLYGGGLWDAFVVKLDTAADVATYPGSDLVFSSYLGGVGSDKAHGIAVDTNHNIYLTGETDSADFPITQGAIQSAPAAGTSLAFVTQVGSTGASLAYSASLGGNAGSIGYGIAVDATGYAFVAGTTLATNFPTTPGSFQTSPGGGSDVFIAKLNPTGSAPLEYSTYLGGSLDDVAYGIALDPSEDAIVAGYTSSPNFPLSSPVEGHLLSARNAFVASVTSAGDGLQFSSYLGGSGVDCIYSIVPDTLGNVFVFGRTSSVDFPTTSGVMQPTYGGSGDAFVAWISPESANPVPTVTDTSPTQAQEGDPGFVLTVNGSNFVSGAVVWFNAAELHTTFVSSSQLTAMVTASDLLVDGTIPVIVENPPPGGGFSDSVDFTVIFHALPAPSIASLTPPSILAGSPNLVLVVGGAGFLPGSKVLWNGAPRTTTFVSDSQLLAFLDASDLASAGTATVVVSSGKGGESNSFTFTITPPNPIPVISGLNPASVPVGGSGFQIVITGAKISEGAVMRWNGLDRPSGVVSDSQLVGSILPSDISSVGTADITVFNPPPGGGESNRLKISIGQGTTSVTVNNISEVSSSFVGTVQLVASVSGLNEDAGSVTFQVMDGSEKIGGAVTAKLVNRVATAAYQLPAGVAPRAYSIDATYSDNPLARDSTGLGWLTITADPGATVLSLPSGGIASSTSSAAGGLTTGYGLLSPTGTSAPIAIANLQVTSPQATTVSPGSQAQPSPTSVLVTEAGILPAPPVYTTRLVVDYSQTTDSGIALVNPSPSGAIDITAEFRDAAGTSAGTAKIHLPPKGHTAKFASALLAQLPEPFLGTLTLSLVRNPFSPRATFAAVNLATAISGRGEILYNTLPLQDLNTPSTMAPTILPQVVDGEGMQTLIYLTNTSASSASEGSIAFYDDAGKPLLLNFGSPLGPQSVIDFALPPNGLAKFSSQGSGPMQAGYAIITAKSGPVPLSSALFMFREGTMLVSRASITDAKPATWTRLYAEVASAPVRRDTGIALVNPGATPAIVNLKLTGTDGKALDVGLILGPHAHTARFLTELFSGRIPADFVGTLDITSKTPVASLTLRLTTNQRGDSIYSTLPSADMNNPPVGVQVLPQVANGDGYSTEFIFINTQPASGPIYLSLFDDSGAAILPEVFW
jgi:hypothetical protein